MAKPASDRDPQPLLPAGVSAWRERVLEQAGFDGVLAARLAADHQCDLHGLLNLVDHGCPPELAARILAPL
jgi:hypothetical protein